MDDRLCFTLWVAIACATPGCLLFTTSPSGPATTAPVRTQARPEAQGALIRLADMELRGQDARHAEDVALATRRATAEALRAAGFRVLTDEPADPAEIAVASLILTVDYCYADVSRIETRLLLAQDGARIGELVVPAVETRTSLLPDQTALEIANYVASLDGLVAKTAEPITSAAATAEAAPAKPIVVAVLDIHGLEGISNAKTAVQLSEYLMAQVVRVLRWRTVPRAQIREQLQTEKKASYSACVDDACQIELGKALAAEKTLSTKVMRLGDECTWVTSLFDLERETAEAAATSKSSCTPTALAAGIDQLVRELAESSRLGGGK